MDSKEYLLDVYSKYFKSFGSGGWLRATVTVDEERRIINLVASDKPKSPGVGGGNSPPTPGGSRQNSVNDFKHFIQLADYRAPKKKVQKFPQGQFAVEIRSKMPIGSRAYLFHTNDQKSFDTFYELLRRVYASAQQRRPSMSRPIDDRGPLSAAIANNKLRHQSPTECPYANDAEFFDTVGFSSEYATVTNRGSIVFDGDTEFIYISSDIYETFDANLSFAAFLDNFEGDKDGLSRIGVKKGDSVRLYVATNQLELLAGDKRVLCAWPYTQIITFGHSANLVRIEFGARTCTGPATIAFRFEGGEAGGPDTAASDATIQFVCRLAASLKPAPPPSERCCPHCNVGGSNARGTESDSLRRGGRPRKRRPRSDDATEDEEDDEEDDAELSEMVLAMAEAEDGVYATVDHPKDSTDASAPSNGPSNRRGEPVVPPHPRSALRPPPPPVPTTAPFVRGQAPPPRPSAPPTLPKPAPELLRRQSSPMVSSAAAAAAIAAVDAAAMAGADSGAASSVEEDGTSGSISGSVPLVATV